MHTYIPMLFSFIITKQSFLRNLTLYNTISLMKVKVKVTHSCPTLCDTTDYTVHGILQARMLEWVAFPFSRGSSQPRFPTLQADSHQPSHKGSPFLSYMIHDQISPIDSIMSWDFFVCFF